MSSCPKPNLLSLSLFGIRDRMIYFLFKALFNTWELLVLYTNEVYADVVSLPMTAPVEGELVQEHNRL